ncbi:MAG: hypothetical protein IT516_04570 [Burkholderiales bacterium]|nr:hypothetical protein [Burkholderiales bacterium]
MTGATLTPAPAAKTHADAAATMHDLAVRVAWHAFVEGRTQAEIAAALDLSRTKVARLVAVARDSGVVNIHVRAAHTARIARERELVARFGLTDAIVVPAAAPGAVEAQIGAAAGAFLRATLRAGNTVAVGWGATLSACARALGASPVPQLTVVSLLGGMTHSRAVNPSAVARRMADAFAATCHQITAPLVVAHAATCERLWREPGLARVRARARRADLALVSVGGTDPDATLFREGLVSEAERRSLVEAGAVGDVLCQFLDAVGAVLDHPVNRRMVAVPPSELAQVREVVVASGGARKARALRAALAALPVTVLITDESAARALVEGPAPARRRGAGA